MKKRFLRTGAVALCLTLAVTMLVACGGKHARVEAKHVDVYVYTGNTLSSKLTGTGVNKVTEHDGVLRVDIAKNVTEVEFDLAPFFAENEKYLGKNFYFTRDDVKKADSTLIKGYAWYQVGGDASNRLYKKVGYENDSTVTAMNKTEIAALENREGEARMYIITSGTQTGKHVLYIDPTTSSSIETGETRVTFRFHGHHGKTAELKVLVNKAAQ